MEEDDEALFSSDPIVAAPIAIDYGIHLTVGPKTFIGFNFVVLDTCRVTIGARVLIGPNVSIFTASHPLDPAERNGVDGPECGKDIQIGDDCWIGGNVTILPGVVIGRGCTIGAASVVTKSVAPFTLVAGNPARFIKNLNSAWKSNEV
jgi:acetyltransferase-like isoleucine patch superfamily enzyme